MLDHDCEDAIDGVLNDWGWDVDDAMVSRVDCAMAARVEDAMAARVDGAMAGRIDCAMPARVDADEPWRMIDRALRVIAKKRGQLDAEEARWLREAEDIRLWEQFGYASMLAYMEAVLGHEPRAARDRLRVAREIVKLPVLEAALANNELSYSGVRELTRVATPETEQLWLDDSRGKNASQIHERVVGRAKGDRPGDRIKQEIVTKWIGFEVLPEVFARLRETRAAIEDELGRRITDTELITFLCESVLSPGDRDGRAKFQIALTVCSHCKQATQDGAGVVVPVLPSTVARAECDAQRIGSIDPETGAPARATQDIPPATARFVMRRDHSRCCAPGCRSARNLEIHHIVPREAGGSHHHSNLAVLCDGCHVRVHQGTLTLRGTAPTALVFTRPNAPWLDGEPSERRERSEVDTAVGTVVSDDPPPSLVRAHVSTGFERARRREEIKQMIAKSGFSPTTARRVADHVLATLPTGTSLDECARLAFRVAPSFDG